MKIKVVCNYMGDDQIYHICNDMWNMRGEHDLTWGDDYTHLIIFNDYNRHAIKIPKENVFGFVSESYWAYFFNKQLPEFCNKVFQHEPEKWPYDNVVKMPFISHHHLYLNDGRCKINKGWTKNVLDNAKDYVKDRKLSIIVSNHGDSDQTKVVGTNYLKRQAFVKQLMDSDLDFDMYGRNWWDYVSDKRYKGSISGKLQGLENYEYSICLENTDVNGMITEKIMDAVLCNTIPIYNGNRGISEFYPECYEYMEYENGVDRVREIISSGKTWRDYPFDEMKHAYLETYNPFNIIKKYAN